MVAGLASAEVTPQILGQDYFLSYTNNSTIADMNAYLIENEGVLEVEEGAAVGYWSSGEADMTKVVNDGEEAYLNLDTAGDIVTNSLIAAEDMNNEITAKESGTGEAFIKATMLLVPSDEIESSFVDAYTTNDVDWSIVNNGDLKFGLYAYEYDVTKTVTEGDTTKEVVEVVTNLVIYHSYYDTPIELADGNLAMPVGYTNFVYEVPDNVDFTQPQEITVTLKQSQSEELFFKVNLGGTDVVSPKGCQEATILECPDGLPFCDEGPWLRCVNNGNVNTISEINFSGTGNINTLVSGINTTGGGEGGGEGGGTPDPEPTVIKLVKLNVTGDMVNGSTPTFTATVTDSEGNTVDASNYTIDASAIDMTKAGLYPVIITATGDLQGVITNYYAVMNLTWFNGTPTQKAVLTNAYVGVIESQSEGSHWMSKSENDRYLAINHSSSNNDSRDAKMVSLYEIATLKSLFGLCFSKWEVALGKAKGSKGVAVSEAAGLVTLGNPSSSTTINPTYAISNVSDQDLGANLQYAFIKNGAAAQQKHDSLAFSTDGNYIYVNTYNPSASRNIISKYSVDKENNQFVWVQDYVGSVSRIRSLELYAIGGRDYVFYGEGGGDLTGNIYVMDTVTGESTLVCSARESAAFDNESGDGGNEVQLVRISGIASGEMYLYAHSDHGVIVVWALRHDATTGAWNTALVREFTQAEYLALCDRESLSNSRNLEVSDDNQYGFILPHYTADARLIVVTDISLAQRKALASATLTPAGSDKDVALGAITATVLDENGDTVAASEYTITTNLIDIATAGEYTVTITPVEGSVYSNAVTAVYTISAPSAAGFNDPEGNAITDTAVLAWLTSKGATQAQINKLDSAAALNEKYLLNLDLENSFYSLKIKSLAVGGDIKVEVELTRFNGETAVEAAINGKLQLWGTADLGTDFADCGLTEISNADFSEGTTAVKSFTPLATGVKFFKAVIVNPPAAE